MRCHTRRRALILFGMTGLVLVVLGGCTTGIDSFDPISSRGRSISNLFMLTLILAAVIMVALCSVLAYILIRFRSRPGGEATRGVGHTHQIEAAWIIGIVVLFAILGFFMVRSMQAVTAPAEAPAITIQVVGHQWWWEFRYPDSNVVTANELHVPVGTSLRFQIDGADVIHSFWVPQFGWKVDAIPGKSNSMTVEVDKTGTFEGACTEFCGAQHAWMRIRVIAEPASDFQAWIAHQQQPAADAQSAIAKRGQVLFLENTCVSCHSVRFADGSATKGGIGPDLTHVGSRETIGAGVLTNTPDNMTAWIRNADSVKPHVLMPGFTSLSDQDIEALMRYLEGLK